jgi:two-component system, NarL family, response regulator LiaR
MSTNLCKEKKNRIRVLLADDHPLVRQALRDCIETQHDFEVVGEAADGQIAVQLTNSLKPDIIIMDISMPGMGGLEATSRIKADNAEVSILVLTVHDENELIMKLFEAGADGYLIKNVFGENVINAIRALESGETVISPSIYQQVFRHAYKYMKKSTVLKSGSKLTQKEIELLRFVAKGTGNKDIANELHISLRTVKAHLVVIFSKLGVNSRTEAVVASLRNGIISIDDLQ